MFKASQRNIETCNPEVKYEPEHEWSLNLATQVIVACNYGTRLSVTHTPSSVGGEGRDGSV